MEGAAIGRAVAEEADRDLIGLAQPRRERGTGDESETAGDDAVGAEHPDRKIGDVHRAAFAATHAIGAREQLGDHRAHRRPFRERVPVPAMGRRDVVVAAQRGAHAGRNRFLTDREVCESRDFAGEKMPFDALFKDANADHHLQERSGERDLAVGERGIGR